ncbi:MAG TPA: hypothetical protein VN739_01345 [Nitrososphaerales archaeon]|nr:hypothetical protein [Nitrososphaerales archaeon]
MKVGLRIFKQESCTFLKEANAAIRDKIPIVKAPIEKDACGSLADK